MARRSRAETTEQTRAAVLAAASDLFAEAGFNATTIEAIVDRAGFTRGAFYAHFTDKADLFATLLAETRQRAMDRIRERVAQVPDAEKIDVLRRWYDELGTESPWGLAYAEFWPQAIRDPALRDRVTAMHVATRQSIEATLDDYCTTAGVDLPIPMSEMAAMILAIGDGVATQRSLDPSALPADGFSRTVAYLWFGVLAAGANPDS